VLAEFCWRNLLGNITSKKKKWGRRWGHNIRMYVMRLILRMRCGWNKIVKYVCGPIIATLLWLKFTGNARADGVISELMFYIIYLRYTIWHFHWNVKRIFVLQIHSAELYSAKLYGVCLNQFHTVVGVQVP
jgi:hypothetical protein